MTQLSVARVAIASVINMAMEMMLLRITTI